MARFWWKVFSGKKRLFTNGLAKSKLSVLLIFYGILFLSGMDHAVSEEHAINTNSIIQTLLLSDNQNCTYEGQQVNHDATVTRTRYETETVAFGETCNSEIQTGTCNNGTLSWTGSFAYETCSVADPVCDPPCENGGTCIATDTCACPSADERCTQCMGERYYGPGCLERPAHAEAIFTNNIVLIPWEMPYSFVYGSTTPFFGKSVSCTDIVPFNMALFGNDAECSFYDLTKDGIVDYFRITCGATADILHTGEKYTLVLNSQSEPLEWFWYEIQALTTPMY
jgi:hypothetical protein